MQNVQRGSNVDVLTFPAPRYHTHDGGRFIGTGDSIIMRDPDDGWVNFGTYRIQVHEPDLLGLWISPGQQGSRIAQKYWARGESCPVAAVFGSDVLTLESSRMRVPWGRSELEFAGGLRGRPVEVIPGPVTGLPIPAHAEIVVEGEIPPPSVEAREEGPFGEWPGYYSGGTVGTGKDQPVIHVRAVYYRDDPILVDQSTLWFGAPRDDHMVEAGLLWNQLEAAGVPNVVGVAQYTWNFWVVAIKQTYAGHARQAGAAVLGCAASCRDGRYVIVVDEDIDPTNMNEVLWAMATRVDPTTDIDLVDGYPGTPLDPRTPASKRMVGDFSSGRAVIHAVRPWAWRDDFPRASRAEVQLRDEMVERFRHILPFPRSGRALAEAR
jgi:4-hydroxy-3-polyprenylbenzoate decarboxylase